MNCFDAQKRFASLAGRKHAFHARDIAVLLNEHGEKLRSTIRRLLQVGIIERLARDLYWCEPLAANVLNPMEEIATTLRSGSLCYVSLESAAARWGIISQIPVDRLTVMATGREGLFQTRFGTIELVHTKADALQIARNTVHAHDHFLPIASKRYTVRNLKHTHRSLDLIAWEELNAEAEYASYVF